MFICFVRSSYISRKSPLVTASGRERLIDWVSVHLSVIGANQYPPRISSSSCGHLTIRENVAAKHLTRIYAWDEDDGSDGEIFYEIVGKRFIDRLQKL